MDDTNGDHSADFTAVIFSGAESLVGNVYDAQQKSVRDATSTALAGSSSYRMVFDTSCIGNPRYVGWRAVMGYDDDVATGLEFDEAPDEPVFAGAVPNPSGPSVVAVIPGRVFESRAGEKTVDGQQRGVGRRRAVR
jgi:hypothetical protein